MTPCLPEVLRLPIPMAQLDCHLTCESSPACGDLPSASGQVPVGATFEKGLPPHSCDPPVFLPPVRERPPRLSRSGLKAEPSAWGLGRYLLTSTRVLLRKCRAALKVQYSKAVRRSMVVGPKSPRPGPGVPERGGTTVRQIQAWGT
jgi:hypothetical protein